MMSLITSLYYEYKPWMDVRQTDLISESNLNHKPNLRQLAYKTIQAMATEMGFSEEPAIGLGIDANPLQVIPFSHVKGSKKGSIFLSALIFFDKNEIPFNGADDPELNDINKVQKFCDDVGKQFSLKKRKINVIDCHNLRLYLRFLEDPVPATKAIKFAIGHELGHIFYNHTFKPTRLYKTMNLLFLGIPSLILTKKRESQADRFSFKHDIEFAEGGIFLFKTVIRNCQGPLSVKVTNIILRFLFSFTHGSFSQRIHIIKQNWPELDIKTKNLLFN